MRAVILTVIALALPHAALAQSCPQPLAVGDETRAGHRRQDDQHHGKPAALRARGAGRAVAAVDGPQTALIGYSGIAWAHASARFARDHEPIKVDGDRRVPAGFFTIGRSFGFAASPRPGYLHIVPGTVCVDDPRSPAYNTITTRAKVGWKVHGENMWRIPEYQLGLLVDYPTDAHARAGSCIFIHRWVKGATGTHGCVALPEPQLESLQDFAQSGAVLAVLPRQALGSFQRVFAAVTFN